MKREAVIQKINSFPSISGAAAKLLQLLDDPDTDIGTIVDLVQSDPGLTANMLKLTNSVYFGLPQKVGSVQRAVMILGVKKIRRLILSVCYNAMLTKPVDGYDLPSGELWRHSIAVSVAAEGLALELDVPASDEVFTAALLHDVGKLILGSFVKDDLALIDAQSKKGLAFDMAEREVLGTDHAEIGAMLLDKWKFPDSIVTAVRAHHDPERGEDRYSQMTDIVHTADLLCLMMGIGIGREGLQYSPSSAAADRLGLSRVTLEAVASKTLQWVNELTQTLGEGN